MEGEETRELPISIWDTMGWAEDAYAMGELNVLLDGHLCDRFPLQTNGVGDISWRARECWLCAGGQRPYSLFVFGLCNVPRPEAHRAIDARLQDKAYAR